MAKKKIEKLIPVLKVQDAHGNPPEVFRLDMPEHGKRFFAFYRDNGEVGETLTVTIVQMNRKQWRKCELAGELEGGHISFAQFKARVARLEGKK